MSLLKILRLIVCSIIITFSFPEILYAATYFTDDFNTADSTDLNNDWVEDLGDWSITDNQLVAPVQDDVIVHNTNQALNSDYYVQVDAKSSSDFTDTPDVLARFIDRNNFYLFQTGNGRAQLYKRLSGNWSVLDDQPFTRPQDVFNSYRLEVTGNQIRGYIDNNLVTSAIDNSFTTTGFGGLRRGGSTEEITFDNFEIGELPAPTSTPSATPSPSPTPSPTPTPTPPVTKVFFAPGFGGSWNAGAILNCQPDPDPSHWSLSPFAENIYNPLLNSLGNSGWEVKPFYYDWRAQVPQTGVVLKDFINANSQGNEKINFVGHSMGGLVGAAYLEQQQGGKLNNLLTIGSPHKGVALAYPAWSGGEIWNDHFLTKIVTTLLIRRCGGLLQSTRQTVQEQIPSVQNLLPTFDYLKQQNADNFITPQHAINNWLPRPQDFWGVRVGTLNGQGFKTLKTIVVKNPNNKDVTLGNWLDGKPTNKIYSNAGDGTVLVESSQIPGAENETINKKHTSLVSSNQGIAKVLNFLGNNQPAVIIQNDTEPNAALVVIGYPSEFSVVDKTGNVKNSKNGMVYFENPKIGNYNLKLLPKSNNTLLILLQVLPNGKTLYKEYNLKGLKPQLKTINFNPQAAIEDILN